MALTTKTRLKLNMITFLVLAVGLSFGMATQVLSILQPRYSVYAEFPDAGGVFTDQEVTYRGVTVGQVGEMEVIEDGVRIQLIINKEYKIPKENVEARVMFKSAVGEQFVDVLPGSDDPPYLEDGSVIPMDQTSIPVSTQSLLTTMEAVLRGVPPADLKGAVDALGNGLSGRGEDIATILESTAVLSEVFAERAPEVEGILTNGTRVGEAFLDSREDFATAMRQLVTVSDSLSSSTSDLRRLMIGSNLTADEVIELIRENRSELNEFLIKFAELNELQAEHAKDLNDIFVHLPTGLGTVVKTFEPATGLVRFGLVNDDANHACSYGTERRSPRDRSKKLPPKHARCRVHSGGGGGGGAQASAPTSASTTEVGALAADADKARLPARMSRWSWSLFYLNGM
jgi:phospholipid/cholesterol/gamma-HCH transport system substrate-binding protein